MKRNTDQYILSKEEHHGSFESMRDNFDKCFEYFKERIEPVDVGVEVIEAVNDLKRCEPEKLKKIFEETGINTKESNWIDLLVPKKDQLAFTDSTYMERQRKLESRRIKLGLREPKERKLLSPKKLTRVPSKITM